ncbi:MAG: hypothetical protein ABI767_15045 [Rhodanobacter sp.]
MSWELIKLIQKETDLRLILPFGLHLHCATSILASWPRQPLPDGMKKRPMRTSGSRPAWVGKRGVVSRSAGKNYETLLSALRVWADSAPDVPALGFIHSRIEREAVEPGLMTPRHVLEHVRERSPDGVIVLQALEWKPGRRKLNRIKARKGTSSFNLCLG